MEVAKRLVMMAATGPVLMAATNLVSMVTVAEWAETGGSECLPWSLGMRKRHQAEKAEAFKAQARHANSTGRSCTNDYLMPTRIGQRQDGQVRMGKGKRRCCELPSQRKMWLSWMGPVMGMPLLVSCLPAS